MNVYSFRCLKCGREHIYQDARAAVSHGDLHKQTYGDHTDNDVLLWEIVDYQNGFKPTNALEDALKGD